MIKVLVLIPSLYDTSPGSRFRIESWARVMAAHGFHFSFIPFEDEALHRVIYQPGHYAQKTVLTLRALARRARTLPLVETHDVVFLYEEAARIGPPLMERFIHSHGVPIVYDFSDPIWLPYVSQHSRYLSYLKWFGKSGSICRLSTEVIVGNRYLADYASRYNPRVTIVPDTVDTRVFRPKDPKIAGERAVVVGWSGSATTGKHLETLAPALAEVSRRTCFKLKVIGTTPPQLRGCRFDFVRWRPETEVDEIRSFDIGIMPLPDDPYTRYRTHLKVRQYMAVGIPSVGSPVGIMPEIIDHGVNGFLAYSQQEWIEKLCLLITNARLRQEMGRAARLTAEESFATQLWAPRVREVFEAAVERGKG